MSVAQIMVAAVPTAKKEAYLAHAKQMLPLFRKHGALAVAENWGVEVPDGEVTSFPMAVKCKSDETVVVSWIIWPDKATAEAGMGAAMQDTSAMPEGGPPFDGKRMIFAGFEMLHQT